MKGWENFDPATCGQRAKNPMSQYHGALNRRQGLEFEDYIKAACEHYQKVGAADIEKTPEPMKVIRRMPDHPGWFTCCFEKKAQPDFKGTLQGGRSIVFDAKNTQGNRIERGAITDEQEKALDSHAALGAACFVVVSLGLKAFFRVPWAVWDGMKGLYGRKYMKIEDLAPFKVPVLGGVVMFLEGYHESK